MGVDQVPHGCRHLEVQGLSRALAALHMVLQSLSERGTASSRARSTRRGQELSDGAPHSPREPDDRAPRYANPGGSKSQSLQIYEALASTVFDTRKTEDPEGSSLLSVLKEEARYRNGSRVSILAASPTSVRGPHVARLRLDEVDEIDPDLREAAYGMAMKREGVGSVITMSSTWHRLDGPMANLIERGRGGQFPVYTSCAFDVLEHCSTERSGRWVGGDAGYENCPACPLKTWCHSERDRNGDQPLAKRSYGHYAIDSLVQKVQGVSRRVFEADYLCQGPKADGAWFKDFDPTKNVSDSAVYDPALGVHLSVDSGVFTAAVAFQIRSLAEGRPMVTVFMDYLAENMTAEANAVAILRKLDNRNGTGRKASTDPAGGSRNPCRSYCHLRIRPRRPEKLDPLAERLAVRLARARRIAGRLRDGCGIPPDPPDLPRPDQRDAKLPARQALGPVARLPRRPATPRRRPRGCPSRRPVRRISERPKSANSNATGGWAADFLSVEPSCDHRSGRNRTGHPSVARATLFHSPGSSWYPGRE